MLIFFVFIHGQTPARYASITGGFTWIEARDAFARISPIWGALVKFLPGGYSFELKRRVPGRTWRMIRQLLQRLVTILEQWLAFKLVQKSS